MTVTFMAVWFAVSGLLFFGMGMHKRKTGEPDLDVTEVHPFNPKRLFASLVMASGIGFIAAVLILYGFEQTLAER
ncbi:MAG: hypothetical protein VX624_03330 [Pseudomonadota bacterium]|nr:hypothetical protein [Pseudomonadota bacterium]